MEMQNHVKLLRENYPWPVECPPLSENAGQAEGWGVPDVLLKANLTEKTNLIVELGSWLGQSTRFILDNAPNAIVIAVDHWNGSPEHQDDWKELLSTLYHDFLHLNWKYRSRLIPVRETTLDGMVAISRYGLKPDLIYIDADHQYESVKADLEMANALFPEAILVGDDYSGLRRKDDSCDYGVRRAVNHFVYERGWSVQTCGRAWQVLRRPIKNGD